MFPHMVFFIMIFSKIIFVDFIFLILSWLRIAIIIRLNHVGKILQISSQNTIDCYSVFPVWFFCVMIFFKIIFVDFTRESNVAFLTKHYELLQCFLSWVFFYFFPKLSLLVLFFLILSQYRIQLYNLFILLTEKLNHVAKN